MAVRKLLQSSGPTISLPWDATAQRTRWALYSTRNIRELQTETAILCFLSASLLSFDNIYIPWRSRSVSCKAAGFPVHSHLFFFFSSKYSVAENSWTSQHTKARPYPGLVTSSGHINVAFEDPSIEPWAQIRFSIPSPLSSTETRGKKRSFVGKKKTYKGRFLSQPSTPALPVVSQTLHTRESPKQVTEEISSPLRLERNKREEALSQGWPLRRRI